jgi:hypothetical protein
MAEQARQLQICPETQFQRQVTKTPKRKGKTDFEASGCWSLIGDRTRPHPIHFAPLGFAALPPKFVVFGKDLCNAEDAARRSRNQKVEPSKPQSREERREGQRGLLLCVLRVSAVCWPARKSSRDATKLGDCTAKAPNKLRR